MLRCSVVVGLLLLLGQALAFSLDHAKHRQSASDLSQRRQLTATYAVVQNTGIHAWQAPAAGDQRGPCPGLNALANHHYIPHNGVVTISQVSSGVQAAYGISADFALFLATTAAVECGDGIAFSIGGPVTQNLGLGGLLGQGQGLSYSHNKFEGDGSPTRGDVFEYGEGYLLQLPLFQGLLDLPVDPNDPNYTFEVLGDYSVTRYEQCVAQDPYYFRGPVGALIPPGTLAIASRLFSNYSAEYPDGYLSREALMTFHSVTSENGSLVYTPGYEHIPDGFSKKTNGDLFSTAEFFTMTAQMYSAHSQDLAFGGNTGTTNSFTGLNVDDVSGGVYNGETLLEGNNLFCFVSQITLNILPEIIVNAGIIEDIEGAVAQWNKALDGALGSIECPTLTNYDEGPFQQYPGWTQLKTNGTY